jgi:RimJ/RimL family protein N-acetyltransferase
MSDAPFVPAGFAVPGGLTDDRFVLVPLGPEHNEPDYAAWTSSMAHIRATPGFAGFGWPEPMPPDRNLADLVRHADDFAARTGFTYTVLDPADGDVIGCVYLYPTDRDGFDAQARSWVRADRAELDRPLWQAVSAWLAECWPWRSVDYAARD